MTNFVKGGNSIALNEKLLLKRYSFDFQDLGSDLYQFLIIAYSYYKLITVQTIRTMYDTGDSGSDVCLSGNTFSIKQKLSYTLFVGQ